MWSDQNPWNLKQGQWIFSRFASAVSAGLVPLPIGHRDLGFDRIPSTRNGVTDFDLTYGRREQFGAMALSLVYG